MKIVRRIYMSPAFEPVLCLILALIDPDPIKLVFYLGAIAIFLSAQLYAECRKGKDFAKGGIVQVIPIAKDASDYFKGVPIEQTLGRIHRTGQAKEETLAEYLVRSMREEPNRWDVTKGGLKDDAQSWLFADRKTSSSPRSTLFSHAEKGVLGGACARIYNDREQAWMEAQQRAILKRLKSRTPSK